MKKKVAATRTIAAEMRISVVEFDLGGCFGRDDGDLTLAAGAEGSAPGTVAACGGGSCGSGGVPWTLTGGTMLGETLLGGTSLSRTLRGETMPVGTSPGGIWLVGTELGKTWLGGIGLGKTGLDGAWLGSGWLVSALGACGTLGRGT